MTWTTYHRRGEVLREVIATADSRQDAILPIDVAGVSETFDDDNDLLAALTLRWHTRLAGRLELAAAMPVREGADGPLDPDGVIEAWRRTAMDLPGIRAILDRSLDPDVDAEAATTARILATSAAKEHLLLGRWAGLGVRDDAEAERAGRELLAHARALPASAPRPRTAGQPGRAPHVAPVGIAGLVGRIRGALAA